MSQNTPLPEEELSSMTSKGDLAACDKLASILYSRNKYEESAALYLKAIQGGFYISNPNPESERNFFSMINSNKIAHDSEAARHVRERRNLSNEVTSRANRAAGRAGIATFIVYMVLVFGGGVTGFLRDFSLLIAAGLAWLAWQLVFSGFGSDA